jgi:hypothetical protein
MDRRYRESLYRVVSIGGNNLGWSTIASVAVGYLN